jgi:4a-hydroxytetrahydrobiopterin dehydratase
MKTLSENEIIEFLSAKLPEWILDQGFIKRDLKFKNFVEAFSFMTAVALKAEKLNHHPDWCNVYNKVSVNLQTHDSGGITNLDLELAQTIDRLFGKYI